MGIKEKIQQEINNLIKDFQEYSDKYLTEDDVRCFLVEKLMKHKEFSKPQSTSDNSQSVPLHTEVRWYGNSGKLKWRSDIVIIDVASLKVKDGMFKISSKGYSFNKPLAIIEIKLRRINGCSDDGFFKKIKKDINKLKKIKKEVQGDYFCCLVILDKRGNIEGKIEELEREGEKLKEVNIFYISSFRNFHYDR